MSPRPPAKRKRRGLPARPVMPPGVPETAASAPPAPAQASPDGDPVPEDIRKMLEAAYT